jgi:hypothetical protein
MLHFRAHISFAGGIIAYQHSSEMWLLATGCLKINYLLFYLLLNVRGDQNTV